MAIPIGSLGRSDTRWGTLREMGLAKSVDAGLRPERRRLSIPVDIENAIAIAWFCTSRSRPIRIGLERRR
jgi:hypothetical protein